MAAGQDPAGVTFDPKAPPVEFEAGNFIREREPFASKGQLGKNMVDLAPRQPYRRCKPQGRRAPILCAGLLTVVYALNFLDRTIFNVLIEPIKKEFALSDTTMACSQALVSCFLFTARHPHSRVAIAQPAQHRRGGLCVLERDDVSRAGAERRDPGAGEDRRRHRRIGRTPASHPSSPICSTRTNAACAWVTLSAPISRVPRLFCRRYVNQHYGWRMAFFTAGLPASPWPPCCG